MGVIETPTCAVCPRLTVALPDWVESNKEVAVTVTVEGFGAVRGAVYNPSYVMLPQEMPLQPAPERLQTTMFPEPPLAVAAN